MRAKGGGRPTTSNTRTAAAIAAAVASLALITSCGQASGYRASDNASSTSSPTPSVNPSYGAKFLAINECAAPEPGRTDVYREVPCDDPEAVARVTNRMNTGHAEPLSGTSCLDYTDFAIDVPVSLAVLEGTQATGEGYACMRNLKPPHPGEPGGGGGPRIEVGDCVSGGSKDGDVITEAACRTKGKKDGATHKIIEIVEGGFVGGFNDPCDYKADAVFTENPIFDSDPARNDRVLCGKKL
ncbi:hypothetical protein [Streptomyces yanii]|uniref:Septum formation-related domain-containing protein n=1 Tax=Streptomyces yanii TaxID=78510 RepID=A0ABV5R7L1_9ACTN